MVCGGRNFGSRGTNQQAGSTVCFFPGPFNQSSGSALGEIRSPDVESVAHLDPNSNRCIDLGRVSYVSLQRAENDGTTANRANQEPGQ